MTRPVEILAGEILSLPTADRAKLLEQIIDSLDADQERDAKWNELAARRDAEADEDPSVLVPLDDAMARLRASIP